jgi:hypothetical protein
MEPLTAGQLVKVAAGGPELDGIVFDIPSAAKVVVAVVDPKRGPVMRTVPVDALTEREDEGADDPALHALIRRTPHAVQGGARAGAGPVAARSGHTRAAMHRTTGK